MFPGEDIVMYDESQENIKGKLATDGPIGRDEMENRADRREHAGEVLGINSGAASVVEDDDRGRSPVEKFALV